MKKQQLKWIVPIVMILVMTTGPTLAGTVTDGDRTLSPYFFIDSDDTAFDRFPLKETQVTVNINGVIADVVVNQKYANVGAHPINARYIFPASTRAAVHGMNMMIGEQVISAKIKERDAAKQDFEAAKKAGKSVSLLKQQRPNVFSMDVANIMPGDTVDVELHYTELLIPTEGTYEFVYPTVVGPRYAGVSEAVAPETDRWIKNPYLKEDHPDPTRFYIGVNLSTGMPLQEVVCSTHQTETMWESKSIAKVILTDTEKNSGNSDFILNYRLAGRKIQSGLMLYEGDDENFFLLMVQPPERVKPEHIPPREYVFVVDVSGSMNGFPLNTAKKLLRDLIGNLRETDRFNVVLFAGGAKVMAPSSVAATEANINNAIGVLDRQRGGGGTELFTALQKGLGLPRIEGISRTMIIVTDGYITAEKDVFQLVRSYLDRTNVFAFGIGSSVNRYLIEGLAKAGLGEPFVVVDPLQAPEAAKQFRNYVASPVLTGLKVSFEDFETYAVEPVAVPDLFAERPILIYGKWRGRPDGIVTITGASGLGQYRKTFRVAETTPMAANHALRYLWARKRISLLTDFNFQKSNSENKAEITSLGLTYNLLTPFTSFVAVHDMARDMQEESKDVKQPLPLPLHVSNLAVGGAMAEVPEPELYLIGIALATLLVVRYGYRKCRTHIM